MFDSDNMYHLEPEERDYKTTLLSWSFNLRPPPPPPPPPGHQGGGYVSLCVLSFSSNIDRTHACLPSMLKTLISIPYQ